MKGQGHNVQHQKRHNSGADKLSKVKLSENYPRVKRNTSNMFKVIRSNTEIAIIVRLRSNLVEFHHVTDDTLQMFKDKGQRSRSRRKVMYQVQRHQTWYGVVIKAAKGWRGSGGLKLQCIRNCHVF